MTVPQIASPNFVRHRDSPGIDSHHAERCFLSDLFIHAEKRDIRNLTARIQEMDIVLFCVWRQDAINAHRKIVDHISNLSWQLEESRDFLCGFSLEFLALWDIMIQYLLSVGCSAGDLPQVVSVVRSNDSLPQVVRAVPSAGV